MDINEVSRIIVDCAYHLHEEVGPGVLESVYEAILADVLAARGLSVTRQVLIPIRFAGKIYPEGFRADLIVENQIIVEIKSVDHLARVHKMQVMTYLKLSGLPIGLLINFGGERLKGNCERLVGPGAKDLKPPPESCPISHS